MFCSCSCLSSSFIELLSVSSECFSFYIRLHQSPRLRPWPWGCRHRPVKNTSIKKMLLEIKLVFALWVETECLSVFIVAAHERNLDDTLVYLAFVCVWLPCQEGKR